MSNVTFSSSLSLAETTGPIEYTFTNDYMFRAREDAIRHENRMKCELAEANAALADAKAEIADKDAEIARLKAELAKR